MTMIYNVKTEGDCEGRTMRSLGYFEGSIQDIALFLADQCAYKLQFEVVEIQTPGDATAISVPICISKKYSYLLRHQPKIFDVKDSFASTSAIVKTEDKNQVIMNSVLKSLTEEQLEFLRNNKDLI